MICSEKEALKKFCPHMRVIIEGDAVGMPAFNLFKSLNGEIRYHTCLSSKCMMWVPLKGGMGDGRCGLVHEKGE